MIKRGLLTAALLAGLFNISVLFTATVHAAAKARANAYADAPLVPEVKGKIRADGILDEPLWQQALVMDLNYEVEPAENIEPRVKTQVLLAHTRTRLYVAFRAYDPNPQDIRVYHSDRDTVMNQDWVGVVLDTFNDQRHAYDFTCNPLGNQTDLIENATGPFNMAYDAIWDSGGRVTGEGYFVEMSIPFSAMRFQRTAGEQVWGFDATRRYPRSVNHHMGLFPRDRNNGCYLCQTVKIRGFKGVKPGKSLEFDPTLSGHLSRQREDGIDSPFEKDQQLDAGLTARWGFTSNLTLSGTVNPDFSQVEADAQQLDINEPFALFFQEKRPFFVEGKDFFNTSLNVVHTRTLRDPSWGIKITGKEGANTIGGYVVRDTLTNLIFPASEYSDSLSLSTGSTASVLRYSRDLGENYTLGALFTNREGGDYYNRVLGLDGAFRFTRRDMVQVQVLGSMTRYPGSVARDYDQPEDSFNGRAMSLLYTHNTRALDWRLEYKDIGKDFRADMGFIPQVDFRVAAGGLEYTWYAKPGNSWWTRFRLTGDFANITDQGGDLLNRMGTLGLVYEGPRQIHARAEFTRKREAYNGRVFDQSEWLLHNCMRPIGSLHFFTNLRFGDRIDYSNTRPGKRFRIDTGFSYNLGMHIKLSLSYTYERLKVGGEKLYSVNQGEVNMAYQFNKRMFLRTILQYADYRKNKDLYTYETDPEFRRLFTQVLFSYKLNPQTVFFLGYSDNYNGYRDTGLPQVNHTFFLKIGYALVM